MITASCSTLIALFHSHIQSSRPLPILGSGLPGAPASSGSTAASAAAGGSSGGYDSALTPMDEDDRPAPRSKSRKAIISDEEYMTPSDEE